MFSRTAVRNGFGGKPHLPLALLVASCLAACATPSVQHATPPQASAAVAAPLAGAVVPGELGIHVTALRVTAGGFMLDLRFRVVDPERAKTFFDRRVPAFLVDETSGAKFGVPTTPKLGRLRPGSRSNIQTDREYGMLFGNPGSYLKHGAKVTLMAGAAQVAALTVQ